MNRVLICEDHFVSMIGIESLMKDMLSVPLIFERAFSAGAAIEAVRKNLPDLLVVDLGLPDMSGLEVIQFVRSISQKCQIIVLTANDNGPFLKQILNLNIQALLKKENSEANVREAIDSISKNQDEIFIDASMQRILNLNADKALSSREYEVLKLMVQGFTSKEISEKLNCSVNTVKTYRVRIMNKSGSRNSAEMTAWFLKSRI